MKKAMRIGVSFLAGLALAAAVCALVPASSNAQAAATTATAQTPAAPQSVSGKVTAVEKNSFSLEVASEKKSSISENSPAGKAMKFETNQNTTIEGALKVGANADVTYREEGGKNIAISVHVS